MVRVVPYDDDPGHPTVQAFVNLVDILCKNDDERRTLIRQIVDGEVAIVVEGGHGPDGEYLSFRYEFKESGAE